MGTDKKETPTLALNRVTGGSSWYSGLTSKKLSTLSPSPRKPALQQANILEGNLQRTKAPQLIYLVKINHAPLQN